MEDVSRLRFRNLLDTLLRTCDEIKGPQEKAILFRVGTIVVNKLRIHVSIDMMIGYEVREFNARIKNGENNIVDLLWDDLLDLLELYRESLATSSVVK